MGTGSFGSTGVPQVFWTEKVTESHPEKTCTLTASGCHPGTISVTGLIDTGADVTILSQLCWPQSWPLTRASFGLLGLGGATTGGLSAIVINVKHPDGQQANIRPYVADAPQSLWGRDCLSQWDVKITTDF